MKEIIIIAGPNGAGKTSFANQYLPQAKEGLVLLNADEVAKELASRGMSGPALDIAAARILLETIEDLVSREVEFMIETTLSSRTYARRIRDHPDLLTPFISQCVAGEGQATRCSRRSRHSRSRNPTEIQSKPRELGKHLQTNRR